MPAEPTTDSFRDRLASFRTRLRLFFLLIVIVPIVAVTVIVFRLIAASEEGQADARIAARQEAALALYDLEREDADDLAARVGRDQDLSAALRADDPAEITAAARALLQREGATRIVLRDGGRVLADVGDREGAFPARRQLVANGEPVATLEVSATTADEFARRVEQVTNLDAVVRGDEGVQATTLPGAAQATLPARRGTVAVGGDDYRVVTFTTPGFGGGQARVSLLEPESRTTDDVRRNRIIAGAVLAGFLVLSILAAALVSRSLQRQIGSFLTAARRLTGGDFSARLPVRGNDEFAELAREFTKMSETLEARLEELDHERSRLELSQRRIGETFASNLDRDALLEIVVRTAVDAVEADGGRAVMLDGDGGTLQVARTAEPGQSDVVEEAERRVAERGAPEVVERDGLAVLAHPLRAGPAAGEAARDVTGVVSVWRAGRPFSPAERERFHYLAGQAAVSMENIGLHETVERQAVTDELTGLSNRRRFQETLAAEVERAKRFGQDLALVLLDIDDFKSVNDTWGHQQGDVVLREVARVLRESTREIDEPARYGGEELAVVLPGTDLEGAYDLAERVRVGIEALALPQLGTGGSPLRVTASFGAAALPASAPDVRGLVAAADEALYEAKRTGKNRTVRAL